MRMQSRDGRLIRDECATIFVGNSPKEQYERSTFKVYTSEITNFKPPQGNTYINWRALDLIYNVNIVFNGRYLLMYATMLTLRKVI